MSENKSNWIDFSIIDNAIETVKKVSIIVILALAVFVFLQVKWSREKTKTIKELENLNQEQLSEIKALEGNVKFLKDKLSSKQKELNIKTERLDKAIFDKAISDKAYNEVSRKFEIKMDSLYEANDTERALLLHRFKNFKYEN